MGFGRREILAAFATCVAMPRFSAPARAADAAAPSADVIAAARKEGGVVWYSGMIVNQVVRPLSAGFEKRYPGIRVQAQRLMSGDAALKIMNEARADKPQADVFDGSATVFPLLTAGLVEPYIPPAAAGFPVDAKDAKGYWTSINTYYMTPAVNTDAVTAAEAPKTYHDLLDAKWRGRMAWTNDPTMLGPPGFIGNILTSMGQDGGMAYLHALAQQKIVNVPAAQRVVLDQVIGGQYAIGLMTFNNHSVISAADGAPVKWLPMSPVIAAPNPVGLIKNAPHPNAARLLIDYIISDEGQAVLRDANYIPANPHVPPRDPTLTPEGGKFSVTVMTPEITATKLAAWTAVYHELFE